MSQPLANLPGAERDPDLHTVAVNRYFRKDAWDRLGLYTREAVEEALEEVRHAKKDARLFRMKTLEKMCACFQLTARQLLEDPSLLQRIPTGAQQRDHLTDLLYRQYQSYMTYSDYLRRLIDRLAPAFRSDPPRLALLKQFFIGSARSCKEVPIDFVWDWAYERCTPEERACCDALPSESEQLVFLANHLTEDIFDSQDEDLSPSCLLRLMAQTLNKLREHPEAYYRLSPSRTEDPPGEPCFSEETIGKLRQLSDGDALSPASLLLSCYARCGNPGFSSRWDREEKEFSQQLLSEFRSWLGTVLCRGRTKNPVTCAERFKYTLRDERRRQVKDILQISSDIARGVSKTNGKTRKDLYYFAFLFGLEPRRALGEYTPRGDLVDLEKNLFEDYYGDYVFRCLSSGSGDSRYERSPTGEGINYKNFEETIYIYYLLQNTERKVPPGVLFDRAEKAIRQCISKARKSPPLPANVYTETYAFHRELVQKNLFRLSEKEFIEYVVQHYAIPTGSGQQAHILAETNQRSAFETLFDHVNYTVEPTLRFSRYDPSPRTLPPSSCSDPREGREAFWYRLQKIVQAHAVTRSYDPDFLKMIQKIADSLYEADFPFRMEYLLPCLTMLRHLLRNCGAAVCEEVLLRLGYGDTRQPAARKKAFAALVRDIGYCVEEVSGFCGQTIPTHSQRQLEQLHGALLCTTPAEIEEKAASLVPKHHPAPEDLRRQLRNALSFALQHRRQKKRHRCGLSISRSELFRMMAQSDSRLTPEQEQEVFVLLSGHFPGLVLQDEGVSPAAVELASPLLTLLRSYPIPDASDRSGKVLTMQELCRLLSAPENVVRETIEYLRANAFDIRQMPALRLPSQEENRQCPLTKPLTEAVLPLTMNRELPEALCRSVMEQNTFAPGITRVMYLAALTEKFACDQAYAGNEGHSDFIPLYEAFLHRANELLREARFQIISPKNMIDTYAIFTLYLALTLPEE